jgi:DNA-binding CsgD family transcriptional regulator
MKLLERERSLHELARALRDVCDGAGRIALVGGEAGIGKTTLIEQFVGDQRGHIRVLRGACDDLFTPRPLGPLHDIAPHAQGNLQALLAAHADRNALFAAVLGELQAGPVIAVFEDVHWADEATLDLLRFLGRRIGRTAALLVLSYRDDELGQQHPLRGVLGDLATLPATRRIGLLPLSEQAVRTLAEDRVLDAGALHRQTGGNPFFVTEVLANAGSLSPTVRDAVLARVARLSHSAQAVLQAAAVIGPRIEPWVLADVTGAEARFVDECLASGMLGAHGNMLTFRHELARQTVLDAISPSHRMALHRMTLDALKTSPGAQADLACLAHHAEAAHERAAVLQYAPAAAQQASAASAHRAAAALYALALRYAADLPPAEHAGLLEAYARECHLIDQREVGVQRLREALKLRRAAGNAVREGAILTQMATMLIGLGQDAEARACAQTAITILASGPPSLELAQAYRTQAALDMINHDLHSSIAWAEQSIALAEQVSNSAELCTAHNILGSSWMYLDYERGCRHLEGNLAAAHSAGHTATVVHAYAQLGSNSSEIYRFREADRFLNDGLAYAAQHEHDRLRLYMLAWQAWTRLQLGAWDAAADAAGTVLREAGLSTTSRVLALVSLSRLRVRRGEPHADALLDEALDLAQHASAIDRLAPLRATRAEAALQRGDPARALAEACAVYDLALHCRHAWYVGELAFWRWRAGDHVSPPEWTARPFALQIGGDWRGAAAEWARLGCPYEQARALADGDYAAQRAALDIFERLDAQPAADDLRRAMRSRGVLRIPRGPRPSTRGNPFGLTTRQMDILHLLSDGLSNAEIASRLYISPKTVDHHVCAVLARLDVHSREDAAAVARQHAIVAHT